MSDPIAKPRFVFDNEDAFSKLSVSELTDVAIAMLEKGTLQALTRGKREAVDHALRLLGELLKLSKQPSTVIPPPRGIFVTDSERKVAYESTCRLLTVMEPTVRHARMAFGTFLELEEQCTRLTHTCTLVIHALERATDESEEAHVTLKQLHRRFSATQTRGKRLLAQCHALYRLYSGYCADTLHRFAVRVHTAADMENNGAACDPHALLRLLEELRAATVKTADEMKRL